MTTITEEATEAVARLDEMTKEEFREIANNVRPDLSDEEFDSQWDAFILERQRRFLDG